jgi:hypothetical protein
MRIKVITLIALLAAITLLVLGLTEAQYLGIPNLFAAMKDISAIYPPPT